MFSYKLKICQTLKCGVCPYLLPGPRRFCIEVVSELRHSNNFLSQFHSCITVLSQVIADMKQHCEDKLLRLYSDYIRTRPGKELGAGLHKAVQDFHSGVTSLDQLLSKNSLNGA